MSVIMSHIPELCINLHVLPLNIVTYLLDTYIYQFSVDLYYGPEARNT